MLRCVLWVETVRTADKTTYIKTAIAVRVIHNCNLINWLICSTMTYIVEQDQNGASITVYIDCLGIMEWVEPLH